MLSKIFYVYVLIKLWEAMPQSEKEKLNELYCIAQDDELMDLIHDVEVYDEFVMNLDIR